MKECLVCCKKYHCCINPSNKGYTAVFIDEAEKIQKKTGMKYNEFLTFSKIPGKLAKASKSDFKGSEARLRADMMVNDKILRLKTKKNNECVFLKNGKCVIYTIRPTICRIYPYWFRNKKGKIKIEVHAGCEYCGMLEYGVTDNQLKQLIKTAKKIEKQTLYYKKNIADFVKKNKIK